MISRFILLLTLAGCAAYPDVPAPRNPVLTATPHVKELKGQCFAGPDTARIRVLCEAELTPQLRLELQRALAARGLFSGKQDGKDGPATREAIRKYQMLFGRDDAQLTWNAAEALGLVAISVPGGSASGVTMPSITNTPAAGSTATSADVADDPAQPE